jgi:hypothetical protein
MLRAFTRLRLYANFLIVVLGAIYLGGCAQQTYQLPPEAPSVIAADRPDGGNPPPAAPSRRGIIVPGDPASGTTRLGGEGSSPIETHTGTSGTRVLPGSSDGK